MAETQDPAAGSDEPERQIYRLPVRPLALTRLLVVAALALAAPAAATSSYHEVERIPTRHKLVALTFDGGGDAGGARLILRTLARKHVGATFFVTGVWARHYPRLARLIAKRYAIGDHTYDHAALTPLSDAAIRAEVRRGARWLRRVTHHDPRPLFRFPYGDRDSRTVAVVNSLGYASVRWSLDTWGWMGPSEGQSVGTVVQRVSSRLRRGDIVLMHLGVARDGSLLDAQALPRVIKLIRRRGYRFVTLDRYVHAPR